MMARKSQEMSYHHLICPHRGLCLVQILGRDPSAGMDPQPVPRKDPIAVLEPDATTTLRHPTQPQGRSVP